MESNTSYDQHSTQTRAHTMPKDNKNNWLQWQIIAASSALLCGGNCALIAWNYMYGKTSLIAVSISATAGFMLNTHLYHKNAAQKLSDFTRNFQEEPFKVLKKTWITLCAGICVGFLTFDSYNQQLSKSFVSMAMTWTMSISNALANFILLSDDLATPITPQTQQGSSHNQYPDSTYNKLVTVVAYGAALVQSLAFTYLNFRCIQSLTQKVCSQSIATCWAACMASTLIAGEVSFNTEACRTFLLSLRHIQTRSRSNTMMIIIVTLIVCNALANGYIALGDLNHLPKMWQNIIIGNGFFVSFCVMHNSFFTKNIPQSVPQSSTAGTASITVANHTQVPENTSKIALYPIVTTDKSPNNSQSV